MGIGTIYDGNPHPISLPDDRFGWIGLAAVRFDDTCSVIIDFQTVGEDRFEDG